MEMLGGTNDHVPHLPYAYVGSEAFPRLNCFDVEMFLPWEGAMVLPSQPLKKAVQGAVVIHTPRSLLEDLNAFTFVGSRITTENEDGI